MRPTQRHRRNLRRPSFQAVLVLGIVTIGLAGCSDDAGDQLNGPAAVGAELAESYNCTSCHSIDGARSTGPTWSGIWGEEVELVDGARITVDEAYVRRSIIEPTAQVVDGFSPIMPAFDLPDDEIEALIAYIRSLNEGR